MSDRLTTAINTLHRGLSTRDNVKDKRKLLNDNVKYLEFMVDLFSKNTKLQKKLNLEHLSSLVDLCSLVSDNSRREKLLESLVEVMPFFFYEHKQILDVMMKTDENERSELTRQKERNFLINFPSFITASAIIGSSVDSKVITDLEAQASEYMPLFIECAYKSYERMDNSEFIEAFLCMFDDMVKYAAIFCPQYEEELLNKISPLFTGENFKKKVSSLTSAIIHKQHDIPGYLSERYELFLRYFSAAQESVDNPFINLILLTDLVIISTYNETSNPDIVVDVPQAAINKYFTMQHKDIIDPTVIFIPKMSNAGMAFDQILGDKNLNKLKVGYKFIITTGMVHYNTITVQLKEDSKLVIQVYDSADLGVNFFQDDVKPAINNFLQALDKKGIEYNPEIRTDLRLMQTVATCGLHAGLFALAQSIPEDRRSEIYQGFANLDRAIGIEGTMAINIAKQRSLDKKFDDLYAAFMSRLLFSNEKSRQQRPDPKPVSLQEVISFNK